MADDASSAVTSFAQYEDAVKEGRFNAGPAAPAEPATGDTSEEASTSAAQAESATEPEAVEDQSVQTEKAGTAPAPKKPPAKAAPKLSLADEHARLLREVVDLRKQRRELQQQTSSQPAPEAGAAATVTPESDKPPVRPKLSTFNGSFDDYEKAVEQYEADNRKFLERQFERREAERQASEAQKRITDAYGAKLAEHLTAHPDYDNEIAQTPMSRLMVDIVLHEGPALGQVLIDDKAEARRISNLPRDVQIFEMGKLAARLNGNGASSIPAVSEPEPTTTTPVKVPAKLGAAGGSAAVLNRPDHGAKSFAEFEAIEKRLAKKGK